MRKIEKALLVFFSGKSNAGGAERMVQYLDDYLHNKGLDTEIVDETKLLNSFLGKPFSRIFNYRHFRKRKAIYMARFASLYLWSRQNEKYLTISNGESTPYFPVDIVMNHGCYHAMELDYGRQDPELSRVAKLQKRGSEIAEIVTTVTEKAKGDLVNYYHLDPEKIYLLPNSVDTEFFKPHARPSSAVKTLAYVGRLEPGKGLPNLLRIAALIEQSAYWHLLIACNTASNADLFKGFAHTEVKVGLELSNINDQAYSQADLVFFPSLSESFGMVTIEAMAAGVPVVGTPVGLLKEMTEKNFPGAHLFGEMRDEDILPYFNRLIEEDSKKVNRVRLHNLIDEEYGIASYRRRLDRIVAKRFLQR